MNFLSKYFIYYSALEKSWKNKLLKIWRKYITGESMKNYFQPILWIISFKLDKQRPIIAHFKDLGMRYLQCDIRIWQIITLKLQWHIIFDTLFYESEFTTVNVQKRVRTWSKNAKKIQRNLWKFPYSIASLFWPNCSEVSSILLHFHLIYHNGS